MNIYLLARRRNGYTARRLVKTARSMEHELRVLDPFKCTLLLESSAHEVIVGQEKLPPPDLLLSRIGRVTAGYALAIVEQFEMMGVKAVNSSAALGRTLDSVRSLQMLAAQGVPVVKSVMVRSPRRLREAVDAVGGPPVLLRLLRSNLAIGAILADSLHAAESTLETLWDLGQNILLQRVLPGSLEGDIRVFVVGDRVLAAIRRPPLTGVFKADIHQPGGGRPVEVTAAMERVARRTAEVLGLGVAAVDLQGSEGEPVVMAVDAAPGLRSLERYTGLDLARPLLEYAVSVVGSR